MSSILNALKKIESEYPKVRADRIWITREESEINFRERLLEAWLAGRKLVLICGILIVAAVGVSLLGEKGHVFLKPIGLPFFSDNGGGNRSTEIHRKRENDSESPKKEPLLFTPSPPSSERHLSETNVREKGRGKLESVKSFQPTTQTDLASRETSTFDPPLTGIKKPPAKSSYEQNTRPFSRPGESTSSRSFDDPSGVRLSKTGKAPQDTYTKQLHESILKLQAISWSEDPQKRIAVINNNIVREGTMVGEYVVMQIEKNEVFLKEGEQTWQLIFQPR
ncbi:hypothetical protein ACFL9U_01290 [Thermodesulfobacteriota bacterium]